MITLTCESNDVRWSSWACSCCQAQKKPSCPEPNLSIMGWLQLTWHVSTTRQINLIMSLKVDEKDWTLGCKLLLDVKAAAVSATSHIRQLRTKIEDGEISTAKVPAKALSLHLLRICAPVARYPCELSRNEFDMVNDFWPELLCAKTQNVAWMVSNFLSDRESAFWR